MVHALPSDPLGRPQEFILLIHLSLPNRSLDSVCVSIAAQLISLQCLLRPVSFNLVKLEREKRRRQEDSLCFHLIVK